MLGYLTVPKPFTEDGWFVTVEVDDDYPKILGRKSEIINVGGEKVHPVKSRARFRLDNGLLKKVKLVA
jgi:acyl-CoA synthetase (AMP-forming)/AMP-acid ligase II